MKKNGTNKNGNIRNFFKPASPAKGSHPSQPGASQTSMPFLPSSPGSLVSSPASGRHTPPPPARPALGRDAVINGSDDDDDDSDASLPEFSVTLPRASAFPPPRDRNSCVTPKAKRTAHDFPSSPLSIRQQPKHKFDMKALLNNAARDDAAEATAQRVAAILREHDRDSESPPSKGPLQQQPANIQEHMLGLMESGRDDEVDRDKILRALERTDARAVHERWYFFKEYLGASPASRTPFPAGAAIGRWAFLDDTEARQGCIEQGIVQTALRKKQNLPDEIFLWLLDELCLEPQEALRVRYIEILALCPDQVRRHVDTEALCRLFQRLGSRWESTDLSARVEMVPAIGEPYPGRTWSHLGSVLRLLSAVAADLSDQAIAGAVKLLLRLGVDGVVQETVDLALAYRDAMQNLMTAVPLSRWDDFCEDVCVSFYQGVQKASLRWQPLVCIPTSAPRPHEFRRRLAAVCLFDEPSRARQNPEQSFSFRAIIDRLDEDDFYVSRSTDHQDLAARVRFLDVVVDDGGRPPPGGVVKEFDAEVDELAGHLQEIFRRIDANPSATAKLEAKLLLQGVSRRLTHSVRTKRPPKKNFYDAYRSKEDKSIPKQQEYMKLFLGKASGQA